MSLEALLFETVFYHFLFFYRQNGAVTLADKSVSESITLIMRRRTVNRTKTNKSQININRNDENEQNLMWKNQRNFRNLFVNSIACVTKWNSTNWLWNQLSDVYISFRVFFKISFAFCLNFILEGVLCMKASHYTIFL